MTLTQLDGHDLIQTLYEDDQPLRDLIELVAIDEAIILERECLFWIFEYPWIINYGTQDGIGTPKDVWGSI